MKPVLRPSDEQAQVTDIGIDYGRVHEHPLNNSAQSLWGQYFVD